ncbi:histidine phosphatase family protein [Cuneatibacter sp. NSJ-177]|uniref:histidine phosphatase family protein n=1 Tax=Cuneatibacter sp. NSJ-177 TaxID=2931401 RepID=UPI001FCFF733|nr:histidine phosphatase family protein [Cuneatibacter sp. NSJ-177]MCJ7834358.1 histidine phosphatase family protein [Cuneatibacter sp. NSJ-177]
MKTQVYFVRHCESEGNACRRNHAQFDGIVTRKGILQSEVLADRFQSIAVTAVYSSDSYRARMTAAPLARRKGLPVQLRMLLREYTIGTWEGYSLGTIACRYPDLWKIWTATPWTHQIPGADPFPTVAERGIEILRRMAHENQGGVVVAVTHSCLLTCMLTTLLGQDISYYERIKSGDNTAVTLVEVEDSGTWNVVFINDSSHLPPNLRRTQYTGRSADTNLAFSLADPQAESGKIKAWLSRLKEENALSAQNPAFLSSAETIEPYQILFARLLNRVCGMLVLKEDPYRPDCGIVAALALEEELKPQGYFLQELGEAIDFFRRRGKRFLRLREPACPFQRELLTRFCFEPEDNGYYRLAITVPGTEGPVY